MARIHIRGHTSIVRVYCVGGAHDSVQVLREVKVFGTCRPRDSMALFFLGDRGGEVRLGVIRHVLILENTTFMHVLDILPGHVSHFFARLLSWGEETTSDIAT